MEPIKLEWANNRGHFLEVAPETICFVEKSIDGSVMEVHLHQPRFMVVATAELDRFVPPEPAPMPREEPLSPIRLAPTRLTAEDLAAQLVDVAGGETSAFRGGVDRDAIRGAELQRIANEKAAAPLPLEPGPPPETTPAPAKEPAGKPKKDKG